MGKLLLRVVAGLTIAGMLLVVPALTNTEQEAVAWNGGCDGQYHIFRVVSPEGPCPGTGEPMQCYMVIYPDCTSYIGCVC
jgi:hypothetical protein